MPELPEVEVVRRGLNDHVVGRRITEVSVTGLRTARRQPGGAAEIEDRLRGRKVTGARRRGKYLWLTLDDDHAAGADCLLVHLGMSGQMLVTGAGTPPVRHLHARAILDDDNELRFVDQRTFGGWTVVPLAEAIDGTGVLLPAPAAHIAADPFEADFDALAAARLIRRRDTEIKRLRPWCPGSGTSTPTKRCGAPGCTVAGGEGRSRWARSPRPWAMPGT